MKIIGKHYIIFNDDIIILEISEDVQTYKKYLEYEITRYVNRQKQLEKTIDKLNNLFISDFIINANEEIILKKYELLTTLEIENNMISTLIWHLKQQSKMLQIFIQIINPKLL